MTAWHKIAFILISFCGTVLHADGFTFPGPGAQLESGRTYRLTWTARPGSNQKLFTMKGGYPVREIATVSTGSNGKGSYDWKASEYGTAVQLQLSNSSGTALFTTETFAVGSAPARTLRISLPAASPNLKYNVGDQIPVEWSYTGDTGSIDSDERNIQYYLDCATNPIQNGIVPLGSNGNGSTSILIKKIYTRYDRPDPSISGCKIILHWIKFPGGTNYYNERYAANATSDAFFTINDPVEQAKVNETQGAIEITSPAAGSTFRLGDRVQISWKHTAWMTTPVDITFAGKKIATAQPIGANGQGSYTWVVDSIPNGGGSSYSLQISTVNQSHYASSPMFVLNCPDSGMQIVSPADNNLVFEFKSSRVISWTKPSGAVPQKYDLKLLNSNNARYSDIGSDVSPSAVNGNPSFTWSVPDRLPPNTPFRLQVYGKSNGCPAAISPNITFAPAGTVQISKPAAGAKVNLKGPGPIAILTIEWNASLHYADQKARITLNRASGETAVIAESTPVPNGGGTFRYILPSSVEPGNDYFVKMTVTGPTAAPIEVKSSVFTLTNAPPQIILPNR